MGCHTGRLGGLALALKLAHRTAALALSPGGIDSPDLADALDTLRIAITIFDSSERLVFANEHYNYLFRSLPPRDALAGLSYEELIRLEVDGGEVAAIADLDAYVRARRQQFHDGDYRPRDIALADGRIVEIKARRTPEGGWIVLWSDATHARHLLGRLESAIELTADAFAFFDSSDRLVMCNTGFAHLHGYEEAERLVGRTAPDIVEEAGRRGLFKIEGQLAEWLAQRSEAYNSPAGAMTLVTASGAAFLVRERATPDGRVTVFTDVTDSRRVESALLEQTNALERTRRALDETQDEARRQATYLADLTKKLDRAEAEADTTKNTLLRTMSHELKTPLNAIIGFSDLLLALADRANPEQVREYAGLIHQGGNNLLRLLNQILDLTKLAAGRYELQTVPVDSGFALETVAETHRARAEARKIAISAEAAPQGILVLADENALRSMLDHLIGNAVGFTQEGGEVRLSTVRSAGRVHIAVSDNGPGVARDDIPRILRPFEQVGRSTTDHTAGAGLGLTLVKAFAELHGGKLVIDSAPGQGLTATLDLPEA